MCALHDILVARAIPRLKHAIDIIHSWPLASRKTIAAAKKCNIPVALERCNAHTRFAYKVVSDEAKRIGVCLPSNHEHAFNAAILSIEEEEYRDATGILCPSEFTLRTFVDAGIPRHKLHRFIYGVDDSIFFPPSHPRPTSSIFRMIYVGVAAVRKGLHYALEAWLHSPASQKGEFLIAGDFIPSYKEKLYPLLNHPSIKLLGHRSDIPALMRECDAFVLPSIEEGFGLVCTEAMASGCVPLVSDACTDLCIHNHNALVHRAGDVAELGAQMTTLYNNRDLLLRLRSNGIASIPNISWSAAGVSLIEAYQNIIKSSRR